MRRLVTLVACGLLACGDDDKAVDWRASDNPCSEEFLLTPEVVAELRDEIKAENLSGEGDAREVEEEAFINRANGIFTVANRLDCKAWLIRTQ